MTDAFFEGTQVGRYEVITRVAVGTISELFLARLKGLGGFEKLVALKVVLPDVRDDEHFVSMFLDEAKLSAELSHPNLGQVFELGREPDGDLFLATEFLSGQTLAAMLSAFDRDGHRLPVELSARVVHDVCLGLHAAHGHVDPLGTPRPVMHRDVAPKNVIVTFDGRVKLIDFALALTSGRRVRTQTGVVKGTPSYIAPERLLGAAATPRADQFSAGVVLHECLTGRRLFTVDLPPHRFAEVLRPPSELNPKVPRALDVAVLRALASDPAQRFDSARAFAKAIADAVPQLLERDEVAALMAERFSWRKAAFERLVAAAQQPGSDPTPLSQLTREAFGASTREPPATSSTEQARADSPERPAWLPAALALAAGVTVVLGATFLFRGGPATKEQRVAPPTAPAPRVPPVEQHESPLDVGDRALARGDAKQAMLAFDSVLAQQPTMWRALVGSAHALEQLGDLDGARARLIHAANQPVGSFSRVDHVRTWCELAELEHRAGRPDAARAALQEAVAIDSQTAERLTASTELAPVVAELAKAVAPPTVDPRATEFLSLAADARRRGKHSSAVTLLRDCLSELPDDPDCTVALGEVFMARGEDGDTDSARRLARDFLDRAPANHPLRARADALLRSKQ